MADSVFGQGAPRRLALVSMMLAFLGSLGTPAEVTADATSVLIEKTASATTVQQPGDSFSYTIRIRTNAAVEALILADGAFDYPQIAITSASYTVNGSGPKACGNRPDNIWCRVGNVPSGTEVIATVNVRVDPNVNVACDKPGEHGTLDETLRNIAVARWQESGTGFSKQSQRVTVWLNCAGYDPTATPPPTTTIQRGPANGTTVTSASFSFTGTHSPTSFRCALDGASFTTCTSPKSYSGLSIGTHFFDVQGVNSTGAGVPVRWTWTIANPFSDIGSSAFRNDILWLYSSGITSGCAATKFCPRALVTREQMASFLVRALKLPATSKDFFNDDESSIHEGSINRLAASGITGGCAAGRYCPKAYVTREQMASFLARAFTLAATARDYFGDDDASVHEGNINRLAASGITGGCAAGRYCPKAYVTREQMAAFLHRALTR